MAKFDLRVLAVIGMFALAVLFMTGGLKYSTVDGYSFIQPQFGRIECEPISSTPIESLEKVFGAEDYTKTTVTTVKCGDTENTNLCDSYSYYLEGSGNQLTGPYLTFQVDGLSGCNIDSTNWCTIKANDKAQTAFLSNVKLGERVKIGGAYYDHLFWKEWIGGKIYNSFVPFGLNVYDSGMKVRYNVQSCNLENVQYSDKANICIASDGNACTKTKSSNTLAFDDWVNYLSTWVYAPIDVNNKIVTYSGQQAYCQINKVYSIGEFSTESAKYKYPKSIIGSVECCPGMEGANARCEDDFKWHAITVGECDANRSCQSGYECVSNKCQLKATCFSDFQCTGQGGYYVDYSQSLTVSKQSCVSGQCKIVETKKVQCTPPNNGCSSGQVCDANQGYICVGQKGPDILCGDGVCSKPYENELSCQKDCKTSTEGFPITYVIFPALGGLLFYLTNKKDRIIWGVMGGIVGLAAAFIVDFLLKNILLTIFGVVFGGILIWLLVGGGLMTVAAIMIAARKK